MGERRMKMGKGMVIVVDDSGSHRFLTCDGIRQSGLMVLEAAGITDGLDKISHPDGEISGVVSELFLGGSNGGVWIAKDARREYPNIPIVIFTLSPQLLSAQERAQLKELRVEVVKKDGAASIRQVVEYVASMRGG